MAKAKLKIHNNFAVAKDAGHQAVAELIERATDQMHETASQRLEAGASRRGYNLPRDIEKKTSARQGSITYESWFGRFFEYGTVVIRALPFIRPGSRAGRKVIRTEAEGIFEKWVRRARVSR